MGLKVAIVGAGHMAALLAERIPMKIRKVIIAERKAEARAVADEVGAVASDQISAVRGCGLVFLTGSGATVPALLQEAVPHLSQGSLVINTAMEVNTAELAEAYPDLRVAAVKILGHAREMSHGSPGVVVIDHLKPEEAVRIRPLLEALGPVVQDDEGQVRSAHEVIVDALTNTVAELRRRLGDLGLKPELQAVAIRTVGPGVLRSLADGESDFDSQEIDRKRGGGETAAVRVSL